MTGDPGIIVDRLHDKMHSLAIKQRFEEAAAVRDRLQALLEAVKRHRLVETLRSADRAQITIEGTTWIVEHARLIDVTKDGLATRALPAEPPDSVPLGTPLGREMIDEALVLAKFFEKHADSVTATCSGDWDFPVAASEAVRHLRT
jgi:DNA polymerase-3 subunit epsilon